jgi:diguanylate cyclase (GGDEF)-like protein/PAS domain S-box-containing protein
MDTQLPIPAPTDRRPLWLAAAILVLTALASVWFTGFVTRLGDRQEHDRLLTLSRTVAATLESSRIASLRGNAGDIGTADFDMVRNELRRVREVNPDFRFVYLMRPDTGSAATMLFLADGEATDSPDYSAPGDAYDGPSDELFQVWRSGTALVQPPHQDDWGSWVTAVAPVSDAEGTVLAILGMDMRADAWAATLARYRAFALAICALLLLLEGIFLYGLARQRRDAQRLERLNGRLARQVDALERAQADLTLADAVFRHTGEAIAVLDPRLRVIRVNPGFEKITGHLGQAITGQTLPLLGEDLPEIAPQILARLREASHWSGTLWAERAGGERFPVEASVDAVRDGEQRLLQLVLVFRDVTTQKRLEDRLRELSQTDALTLLANRRRFDEVLEDAWRRAMRSGAPVSLLMIDVDFFKSYNDLYGHPEGDRCLQQVAAALADAVATAAPEALVARYGGEEFAVILPGAGPEEATVLGEAVRARIEALAISHRGHPHGGRVTISVGTSTRMAPQTADLDELTASADAALYRAKQHGRNSVVAGAQPAGS